MYASWPQGLAILLQADYKPTHNSLKATINSQCAESLNLFHSTGLCSVSRDEIELSAASPILSQVIIKFLVSERKHIQSLAETYLPSDQLTQLALKPGSLFGGYQAFHACEMLKTRDIDVKWAMCYPWLMYSSVEDIELAEVLWNAGFRDVDEVREDGLTTLMQRERGSRNLNSLRFSNWLVRKGADLYRESPSGIPALHYLAYGIGRSELYDAEMVQKNLRDPEILQLLETILLDPFRTLRNTLVHAL
ncbi:hypothetical protein N7493_009830 [Penicillium malachiteum]|uniref:Uncharacterized protein n=1 Tax=Penicillium malachiteum TaxID=1324776 RepID=A0AAD6MRZ1_9EURO|nr:hypothetical protein N7493_009830 [Penicillium malachiteum]